MCIYITKLEACLEGPEDELRSHGPQLAKRLKDAVENRPILIPEEIKEFQFIENPKIDSLLEASKCRVILVFLFTHVFLVSYSIHVLTILRKY